MNKKSVFKSLLAAALLSCALNTAWAAEPVEIQVFTSPYCPHCRHMEQDGFVEAFAAKHKDEVSVTRYDVTENGGNIIFLQVLKEKGVNSAGIPAMVIGDEVLQGYPRSIGSRSEEVLQQLLQARRAEEAPKEHKKASASAKANTPAAAPVKQKETPAKLATQPTQAVSVQQPVPAQTEKPSTAKAKEQVPASASEQEQASVEQQVLEQHKNFFNQITVWAIIGAGLADGINPCAFAVIVFFISFLN